MLTINGISATTKQDKFLQNIRQGNESNDWKLLKKLKFDHETFNLLKQYRKFNNTLMMNLDNGIVLKDNRIVLPEIFHKTLPHIGHP